MRFSGVLRTVDKELPDGFILDDGTPPQGVPSFPCAGKSAGVSATACSARSGRAVFARGFWARLWCALFRPQRVYGAPFSGGWDGGALLFALLTGMLVQAVTQTLSWFVAPLLTDVLSPGLLVELFAARLGTDELVRALLVTPVVSVAMLCAYACVLHALLWMAQGAERGYAVTLQTVCYAYACMVFTLLPFNGSYLAVLWWLGGLTVGLRLAHGSRWSRILPVMALHVAVAAWLICLRAGLVTQPSIF